MGMPLPPDTGPAPEPASTASISHFPAGEQGQSRSPRAWEDRRNARGYHERHRSAARTRQDAVVSGQEEDVMLDLIVETDLGHDPDDFFTLCYLAAVGVRLRAITIVPGDRDQLAVARLLVKVLGLEIPVGVSKPDSRKSSSGGVHHELLAHF